MSVEPELIADYTCITGEGPLWHPAEQRVYQNCARGLPT